MTDTKYDLFYKNICSDVTSSVYDQWEPGDFNSLSSSERTIYYDSNIAFTSGDKSIVSTTSGDGSLLAVPDLYGTLKGLNTRINDVKNTIDNIQVGSGKLSTADALLFINAVDNNNDSKNDEYIISPGNASRVEGAESVSDNITNDADISLQRTKSNGTAPTKFTVNGDDFTFTVGENAYTLTDIIGMIEELRARTEMFKTNIIRNDVDLTNGYNGLSQNVITGT